MVNEKLKRAILVAIGDSEMVKILDCATFEPKSVSSIIRETGISHSTAYRKINWMLQEGLLYTEKLDFTSDGKKFSLFRSVPKSIDIKYESGRVAINVEYNIDVLERTSEKLFSLDSG